MTHTASSTRAPRTPATLAAHDLTPRGAVAAAAGALGAITVLDLFDGHVDFVFSLGFALVVLTIALAVDSRNLFTAGVLPPALLLVFLFLLCLLKPGSVAVEGVADDAGLITRYIASVVDHGLTLVVGHALALAAVVWRVLRGI